MSAYERIDCINFFQLVSTKLRRFQTNEHFTVTPQNARNSISEDVIFKISWGARPHNLWRLLPLAGLRSNPPYHEPGSAPGNGWVTSAIHLNGEKKAAIRCSFEIGIGGEGDQKFCELISGIREAFGIPDQVQIAKLKVSISQHESLKQQHRADRPRGLVGGE